MTLNRSLSKSSSVIDSFNLHHVKQGAARFIKPPGACFKDYPRNCPGPFGLSYIVGRKKNRLLVVH